MDNKIELKSNNNLILISGTGRSGTNITKAILSRHRDVLALPFEHRFTIDPNGIIDLYNTIKYNWSPYIIDAKIEASKKYLFQIGDRSFLKTIVGKFLKIIDKSGLTITPPSYFEWELSKWFPNYYFHLDNLFNKLVDFQYRAVYPGSKKFKFGNKMNFVSFGKNLDSIFGDYLYALITDILKNNNKSYFVEDNTWSILYSEPILNFIPNSKLIHIYRDPRDVVVSLMSQRWAPSDLNEAIIYYSSIMNKIIEIKKMIGDNQLIEICFEKLISSPSNSIKKNM